MNIKNLFIASLAALAMTACSNDEALTAADDGLPIQLSSTVEAQTRAFNASNIRSGSTVYVWADMINLSDFKRTDYFYAWTLTADGAGGLSSDEGVTKRYPATNMLNFFAVTGNLSGVSINEGTTPLPMSGLVHAVQTNQTTEASYYKSDLLYAQLKGQEPSATAVPLPFHHMLSKVQIVLVPGNGGTGNDLLGVNELRDASVTVKILNVQTRASLTIDTTLTVTPPAVASAEQIEAARAARASMITVAATSEAQDITVETKASAEADIVESSYGDAIVVPQTITAGTRFIEVSYKDQNGEMRSTYYTLPSTLTLQSGKRYLFRLVCDRLGTSYTVTPTIAPWTAETLAADDPLNDGNGNRKSDLNNLEGESER